MKIFSSSAFVGPVESSCLGSGRHLVGLEEGGVAGSEKDQKPLEFLLCEIIMNFIFSALEIEYSVHGWMRLKRYCMFCAYGLLFYTFI